MTQSQPIADVSKTAFVPSVSMLIAGLLLSSCQPADYKVKSVRERLEAGETVEFTEMGFRSAKCSARKSDWTDLRLQDGAERERIVVRDQSTSLATGLDTCFRIGSTVILNTDTKSTASNGLVKVRKISFVKSRFLDREKLLGEFFSAKGSAAQSEVNNYVTKVLQRLQPKDQDVLTLIDYVYVGNSAVDEKALIERKLQMSGGDGYIETKKEGEQLFECKNKKGEIDIWKDMEVASEFIPLIQSGALRSWYVLGDRNCFAQGSKVNLKVKRSDPATLGTLKINKIKGFKLLALDAKYFDLGETDFASIKSSIEAQNASLKAPTQYITVMDFEITEGTP